jgi:exodeoxyribonuclease-3
MRIASWNVNSVRTRLEQISDWLLAERPEVLCLQETKVADPLFPHASFQALGYDAVISGQKAYNGVAILSTLPIEDVRVGFSSLLADAQATDLSEQKRLISARIEGLRVLNLYVPNGSALNSDKYHYKLDWLACLKRYVSALQKEGEEPLIMVGDFNIAPEDRDIHDPARLSGGIMAPLRPLELVGLPQRRLGVGPGLAHRSHLSGWFAAGLRHRLRDPSTVARQRAAQRPCARGGAPGLAP